MTMYRPNMGVFCSSPLHTTMLIPFSSLEENKAWDMGVYPSVYGLGFLELLHFGSVLLGITQKLPNML